MSFSQPEFVLGFFAIVVGIPVVCNTLIKLIHGPRNRKWENRTEKTNVNSRDSELLEEIYLGLKDLGKRVDNLETILDDKGE